MIDEDAVIISIPTGFVTDAPTTTTCQELRLPSLAPSYVRYAPATSLSNPGDIARPVPAFAEFAGQITSVLRKEWHLGTLGQAVPQPKSHDNLSPQTVTPIFAKWEVPPSSCAVEFSAFASHGTLQIRSE